MINTTNIANTNATSGIAEKPRSSKKAGEAGGEFAPFAYELLQAGMGAAPRMAQGPEMTLDLSALGVELGSQQIDSTLPGGAQAQAMPQDGASLAMQNPIEQVKPGQDVPGGSRSAVHASTIAKSELAQKSAAGMSTAAAIAGLKPWSNEWVFEGFEGPRPELKPLISDSGTQEISPELKAAMGPQLQALFGLTGEASPAEAPIQGHQRSDAPNALHGIQRGDAGPMPQGTDAAGLMGLPGMEGMNGAVEGMNLQPGMNPAKTDGDPKAKNSLGTELSGSDFLSALNSVKTGGKAAQSRLSGDSGQGGAENGAAGARSQAQLKRPNLKMIKGGANNGIEQSRFADLMSASTLNQTRASEITTGPNVVELTGHTAKGAGSRDRLSTDATFGLSADIRNLSAHGGGEIRIRLKPEDLGELHLRVVTRGNDVGLQIRASDDRAMKVIEESMGLLKDSLAAQNLSLGKVELAVGQSQSGAGTGSESGNQAQQGHHGGQDLSSMMGQEKGQGNREQSEGWARESAAVDSTSSKTRAGAGWSTQASANRARAAAASGRLDVTA